MTGGLVIQGSKNIFTVRPPSPLPNEALPPPYSHSSDIECRIKGKIIKNAENMYNPIAPGDRVKVEQGMITAIENRKNYFSRFNQKGNCTQLLAANVDLVLCMTTHTAPPFRPRFLDRVLLQADIAEIPALIICNKIDLGCDDIDVIERLENFRQIGYEVIEVSAKTGQGIDELRRVIAGKCSVLTGQSGVGKSSLINAVSPELNFKTGAINEKYDRGNHTTTMSLMVEIAGGTWLIDTPGIRRFVPDGISAQELVCTMREFAPLAGKCTYGMSCSHRTEPGCKIMEAVAAGVIHEDRYTSFLRMYDELAGKSGGIEKAR